MKGCNQCGKCCVKYGGGDLVVTTEEFESWSLFTPEIAQYVYDEKIWCDPKTGKLLSMCPWLEELELPGKYGCAIYLNRPDDCKQYPVTIEEMERDGCEMLEVQDLVTRKQAYLELDRIMAGSRSSSS